VRAIRITAILVLFTGLSLSSALSFAQQDQAGTGDPVADAARRARAQKKDAPKPKKVITEDDIATKPAVEPAPAATSTANAGDASAATPEKPKPAGDASLQTAQKEDTNSEAYWRKRFAAQRKRISNAEQELDVLQREAEKADVQYYSDPQKAMNEQFTRKEINEKSDKIAAKKKEIADLKQQLSDLEDELHRAGGEAGWAR
jgi:chromosome segregation ATPase